MRIKIFKEYRNRTLAWDGSYGYGINFYLFNVNNRNTRKISGIFSNLVIKTPERRDWGRSSVVIITFEHISNLFLVFLLLTLTKYMLAGLLVIYDLVVEIFSQKTPSQMFCSVLHTSLVINFSQSHMIKPIVVCNISLQCQTFSRVSRNELPVKTTLLRVKLLQLLKTIKKSYKCLRVTGLQELPTVQTWWFHPCCILRCTIKL